MSALTKIMTGAAGLAALAGVAMPAAAQYGYPGYGSQYGYGQNSGLGVVGAIIGALGGNYGQYRYGNYGYGQTNDRSSVDQCTATVQQRLSNYGARNYGYGNYGYGNTGYGNNGYGNNGYNGYNNNSGAQIAGITRIEHRNNGVTKIYGVAMTTGAYSGYNRGYNNGYNQGYGNGYNQGYGQGYGNVAANPDLSFDCKIDRYGRLIDVNINRMSRYDQGNYYYANRQGY